MVLIQATEMTRTNDPSFDSPVSAAVKNTTTTNVTAPAGLLVFDVSLQPLNNGLSQVGADRQQCVVNGPLVNQKPPLEAFFRQRPVSDSKQSQ